MSLTDFLKLLATPHKRMLKFSGRSRRSEYWLFQVQFIFLLCLIYGFDAAGLSVSDEYKWFNLPSSLDEVIYSLINVTFLYALIPSVSLAIGVVTSSLIIMNDVYTPSFLGKYA